MAVTNKKALLFLLNILMELVIENLSIAKVFLAGCKPQYRIEVNYSLPQMKHRGVQIWSMLDNFTAQSGAIRSASSNRSGSPVKIELENNVLKITDHDTFEFSGDVGALRAFMAELKSLCPQ
ncbi:MAG: hypothetical protein H0X02_12705 [Nitrosomonas sp.]|nr:hypothetical protein [Nitrosomonas sp.]